MWNSAKSSLFSRYSSPGTAWPCVSNAAGLSGRWTAAIEPSIDFDAHGLQAEPLAEDSLSQNGQFVIAFHQRFEPARHQPAQEADRLADA